MFFQLTPVATLSCLSPEASEFVQAMAQFQSLQKRLGEVEEEVRGAKANESSSQLQQLQKRYENQEKKIQNLLTRIDKVEKETRGRSGMEKSSYPQNLQAQVETVGQRQ